MSGMERYQTPEVEALARRGIREVLERITTPELHPINLDPYPGTVGDVADEVARFVLELEGSGVARGLADMVRDRLAADSDECRCSRTERVYCHSSKCHGGADVVGS